MKKTTPRFPGRIRSIFPAQWHDCDFVDLSFEARLLVLAVRNFADDNGIFKWQPKQLKMYAFPADNLDIEDILNLLVEHRFVRRYSVNSEEYAIIRNFAQYQTIQSPTFKYPVPDFIGEKGYEPNKEFGFFGRYITYQFDTDTIPIQYRSSTSTEHVQTISDSIGKIRLVEERKVKKNIRSPKTPDQPRVNPGSIPLVSSNTNKEPQNVSDKSDTTVIEDLPKKNPLDKLPILEAAYWEIWELIKAVHKTATIPKPDSKKDLDARNTLARLVNLDGFEQQEIVDALTWGLQDEGTGGGFCWQLQIGGITGLRTKKGELCKFQNLYNAWKRQNNGNSKADTTPDYAGMIVGIDMFMDRK